MSEDKETISENKELEKAMDEMDILNPEKKEVYRVDAETIKLSNVDYKIIENYRDAFDLEQLENRYSDYLLKYDYIVGDIAYQKLRLRGFFDDQRKGVPIDMKISHLEDYLIEYCSFGSPYFVFERINKKKEDPESYFKKKRNPKGRGRRKKSSHSSRHKNKKQKESKANKNTKSKKQENNEVKKKKASKKFKMKQKKETTKQGKVKEQIKEERQFKIRKKKN
ncbi:MAG: YutD family protein [Atopostipes suicloacalis]|nr:YutD family protein [Atopostipes suicloacalis]